MRGNGCRTKLGCVNILGGNESDNGSGLIQAPAPSYPDPLTKRGYFSFRRRQKSKYLIIYALRHRENALRYHIYTHRHQLGLLSSSPSSLCSKHRIGGNKFDVSTVVSSLPSISSVWSNRTPRSHLSYDTYCTFLSKYSFCTKTLPQELCQSQLRNVVLYRTVTLKRLQPVPPHRR